MALSKETLDAIANDPQVFIGCLVELAQSVDFGVAQMRLNHDADPAGVVALDKVADLVESNNSILKEILEAFGVANQNTIPV